MRSFLASPPVPILCGLCQLACCLWMSFRHHWSSREVLLVSLWGRIRACSFCSLFVSVEKKDEIVREKNNGCFEFQRQIACLSAPFRPRRMCSMPCNADADVITRRGRQRKGAQMRETSWAEATRPKETRPRLEPKALLLLSRPLSISISILSHSTRSLESTSIKYRTINGRRAPPLI